MCGFASHTKGAWFWPIKPITKIFQIFGVDQEFLPIIGAISPYVILLHNTLPIVRTKIAAILSKMVRFWWMNHHNFSLEKTQNLQLTRIKENQVKKITWAGVVASYAMLRNLLFIFKLEFNTYDSSWWFVQLENESLFESCWLIVQMACLENCLM